MQISLSDLVLDQDAIDRLASGDMDFGPQTPFSDWRNTTNALARESEEEVAERAIELYNEVDPGRGSAMGGSTADLAFREIVQEPSAESWMEVYEREGLSPYKLDPETGEKFYINTPPGVNLVDLLEGEDRQEYLDLLQKQDFEVRASNRTYNVETGVGGIGAGDYGTVIRPPEVSGADRLTAVAAPLLASAMLGPLAGSIASAAPAAVQPALTSALTAAATGGDPLTGAITGGLGSLAEPVIAGADLGTLGTAGVEGLTAAGIAELTGGDPLTAGLTAAGTSLGKDLLASAAPVVEEPVAADTVIDISADPTSLEALELRGAPIPETEAGRAFSERVAGIEVPEISNITTGDFLEGFQPYSDPLEQAILGQPLGSGVPAGLEGVSPPDYIPSVTSPVNLTPIRPPSRIDSIESDLQYFSPPGMPDVSFGAPEGGSLFTGRTVEDLPPIPPPPTYDISQMVLEPELTPLPEPQVDLTPPEIELPDVVSPLDFQFVPPTLDIAPPPVRPPEPIRLPTPVAGGGGGAAGGLLSGGSVTNAVLTGDFSSLGPQAPAPTSEPTPIYYGNVGRPSVVKIPTPAPIPPAAPYVEGPAAGEMPYYVPAPAPAPAPTLEPTPEPVGVEPPVETVEAPVEAVEPTDIFTDTVEAIDTTAPLEPVEAVEAVDTTPFAEADLAEAREEGLVEGQEGLAEAIEKSNQLTETLESTRQDLAEQRDVTEALQSDIDGLNESVTGLQGTVENLQGKLSEAQEAKEAAIQQGNQQLTDSITKYEGLLETQIANSNEILANAVEAGNTKVDEAVAAGKAAVDEAVAAGEALGEAKYGEGLGTGRGQGAGAGLGLGLGVGLLGQMLGQGTGVRLPDFEDYQFRKTYQAPELLELAPQYEAYQAPAAYDPQANYAQTIADEIRNLTSFPALSQDQVQNRLGLFNDALLQEAVMQNLYGAGGR